MMVTVVLTNIVHLNSQAARSAGIRSLMVPGVSEMVTVSTIVILDGVLSVLQTVTVLQMSTARTFTYLQ